VHGYLGNSYDLRKFKSVLKVIYPEIDVLISKSNETNTENTIQSMAENLAYEINDFINNSDNKSYEKISFIGYSLGGVIIRATLGLLSEYKDYFHTFMSVSSPHMGCLFQSSSLVNMGMWIMKRMNESESLKQLLFCDSKNPRKSFLYELSKSPELKYFSHVVFLSCPQDTYSPYESARIEITDKMTGEKRQILSEMAKNIVMDLRNVYRIDIGFVLENKGVDSVTGREAHIEYLDNDIFMKILIYCNNEFF